MDFSFLYTDNIQEEHLENPGGLSSASTLQGYSLRLIISTVVSQVQFGNINRTMSAQYLGGTPQVANTGYQLMSSIVVYLACNADSVIYHMPECPMISQ